MPYIMGVVGSARRKGNTDLLVSRVLEGAAVAGADTEKVLLGGLEIRACEGCHRCWRGKPCRHRDDMRRLYRMTANADALVFGTPVYWYGPTALMKAFLDRFVYFNCPGNRPQVQGKAAALVVPFEEEDPAAAELLVALFERSLAYLEMRLVGTLLVPGVSAKGDVLQKAERLAEAEALGRGLVEELHHAGG